MTDFKDPVTGTTVVTTTPIDPKDLPEPRKNPRPVILVPIDLKDIPPPKGGRLTWQEPLLAFLQGGNAYEIVASSNHTPKQINTGLRGAIRTLELQDKVRVFTRQGVVYLKRLPGADES